MTSPCDVDLDRNPANFQPLTPLTFLERAAAVYPKHTAIIQGPLQRNYAEFYTRARKLASALAKHGIKRGDTVSVMLANTPAMLEAHYGVPMTQGVLNTLNTRLDAPIIAFSLDHAETKVLITDREFSRTVKEALKLAKVKPLVIDYDDPEYSGPGERLGSGAIDDTKAKRIKGFPPPLRPRSLNDQHNFANMFAGLYAPVRVGGLFQRECAVHQRSDAAFAQKRHHLRFDGSDHRRLVRVTTGTQRRASVVQPLDHQLGEIG